MAVGCFSLRIGSVKIDDLRGAARTMPWTSLAFAIGGLGLIGVPLTAGFISKWYLLTSSFEVGRWPVAALMLVSSLLAVVYVWRVVETIYFAEPSELVSEAKEAPLTMLIPLYLVIGATVLFGLWPQWPVELATNAAEFLFPESVQ